MVTFSALSEEEMLMAHAAARRTARPAPAPSTAPRFANVSRVLELDAGMVLRIRDEAVLVPPVSYRDGLQLERIRQDLVASAETDDAERVLGVLDAAVSAMSTMIRPVGWRARARRRLGLWNPLRSLTEREVGELLGFLSTHRATSHIRLLSPMAGSGRSQS
jgi:hypothetical protein